MKIAVLGLALDTGNKGCEALTYSFFEILNKIAADRGECFEVGVLTGFPTKRWIHEKCNIQKLDKYYIPKIAYDNLIFRPFYYVSKRGKYWFSETVKQCNCIFDFTAGDSFTDIYGRERFFTRTRMKRAVIDAHIPLVLGSQTIGPFKDSDVLQYAAQVIKDAYEVYVRDELSYNYTKEISGRTPVLTSDVAFVLPYKKGIKNNTKVKIGFNPSGLLWNGGYDRNNQFNLRVDYQEYCNSIIDKLIDSGKEVHLIPHAYSQDLSLADNDLVAINELHNKFPETILAPQLSTPMDIKTYISEMDIFIGARMHATIGALSSKTPVIPFSYSRKFEGLFESLKYPYVISGKNMDTDGAVGATLAWIENKGELMSAVNISYCEIDRKTKFLISHLSDLLKRLE